MKLDIVTIVAMQVLVSALQLIAFSIYRSTQTGNRDFTPWLSWSALSSIGYAMMFLRLVTQGPLHILSIVLTNVLIFASYIALYKGIVSFFGKPMNRLLVGLIISFFLFGSLYVVIVKPDANLRSVILYLSATAITIACGISLLLSMNRAIRGSLIFLAVLFFFQSVFLIVRSGLALFAFPVINAFEGTWAQISLFLVPFTTSCLWAFGILIMENQRSLSQNAETSEVLRSIFNTHPDAVLITRRSDGVIVDVNGGFTHLLGLSLADVAGKKIEEVGIWEKPAERASIVKAVDDRGLCENCEATLKSANGLKIDSLVSCRLFQIKGVTHVLTVVHDITLRKHMENNLRKSEEKYRLLIENSYDIIYTIDPSGMFTFVSPVWTRLLGHETYEVVGRSYTDFVHPDDLDICREFLEGIGISGERGAGVEYRVRHKDGQWLWHMSGIVPFKDSDGKLQGYYGISRDINETKRLVRELEYQATTDSLTGVLNRRCFIDRAHLEFKRAVRLGHALSIALIDIDYFKRTNDTWGHSIGDKALIHFSQILRGDIREIDVLGRFGGDEFVLLLPETAIDASFDVLERLRKTVSGAPLELADSVVRLTMSAGIAGFMEESEGETLDAMLVRADKALYEAKARGRDCVSLI